MLKDRKFDGSWLGIIMCFVALYFKFGGDLYDYMTNPETKVLLKDLTFWGMYFGGGFILYLVGSFAPSDIVEERKNEKGGFGWGRLFGSLWGSMPVTTHYYKDRQTGQLSAGDVSTNLFFALARIFAPVIFFFLIILAYIVLLPVVGLVKFIYNWLFLGSLASALAARQLRKNPYQAIARYRVEGAYKKAIGIARAMLEKDPADEKAKVELLCSEGFMSTEGFEGTDYEGEEVDVEEINKNIPEDAIKKLGELLNLSVSSDVQGLKDECVIYLGEHLLWCITGDNGMYLQYLRDDVFDLVKTIYQKITEPVTDDPELREIQDEWSEVFQG